MIALVEVAGFEPASPGDRLRLLRAEGRPRFRAPTGGGPFGRPGFRHIFRGGSDGFLMPEFLP